MFDDEIVKDENASIEEKIEETTNAEVEEPIVEMHEISKEEIELQPAEDKPQQELQLHTDPVFTKGPMIEPVTPKPKRTKKVKAKKAKKRPNFFVRAIACLLSGILLGAGVMCGFIGVKYAADYYGFDYALVRESVVTQVVESESGLATTDVVNTVSGDTTVYDVTAVVEEALPAMVTIMASYTAEASYFGQTYTQEASSSGSGFIIGENGEELLLATNNHVIYSADDLTVQFIDESIVTAYVKGTDADKDLAVLAVNLSDLTEETKANIAVATLGDSDDLMMGEPVIAIGNALGYGLSVTTGVVSATDRVLDYTVEDPDTFIQTDAAINEGNSGGALLNMRGEVIGINSAKISGTTVEGMGYAIPISAATPIIDDLSTQVTKIKVSDEERGYLGVSVSSLTVTEDVSTQFGIPQGIIIAEVQEDGAAGLAGIQAGDIIVSYDGVEVTTTDELLALQEYYEQGVEVEVIIMRMGEGGYTSKTFTVVLGGYPVLSSDTDTEAEVETEAEEESSQKSGSSSKGK
ncbi:MAG: trypsin-like peptidase domain-containing protein [Lachnospiraceae bacterium]